MKQTAEELVKICTAYGPLKGKDLLQIAGPDDFYLWAACNRSAEILTRVIGTRYLRLDRQVENFTRLSPSIGREFYSFTIIGTTWQLPEIEAKAERLQHEIAGISRNKYDLAHQSIRDLVETHDAAETIKKRACFVIAGDVVYGMAHAEPRPEISTGRIVRGSDLDIIVIVDNLPAPITASLDAAIYELKYRLLINPAYQEEIDYIVKDIPKVREQLEGEDFKSMVAVKILNEAEFLFGSRSLFHRVKNMLAEKKIPCRLRDLEEKAQADRKRAEEYLLFKSGIDLPPEEAMKLFFTAEEKEEIF